MCLGFKDLPGIGIKPEMSRKERKTESMLVQERWKLISTGTERQNIKIRGNTLYANKTKYGSVVDWKISTRW